MDSKDHNGKTFKGAFSPHDLEILTWPTSQPGRSSSCAIACGFRRKSGGTSMNFSTGFSLMANERFDIPDAETLKLTRQFLLVSRSLD